MELDAETFVTMSSIEWFSRCGMRLPEDVQINCQQLDQVAEAIDCALSADWQDVRTEAQGRLTGYLAKHCYDAYDHWNELATGCRARIQNEIAPRVEECLHRIGAEALLDSILLDLNRIAIHAAYKKRFRRIPDFFDRLFQVYRSGHLPCGWTGDLNVWPEGMLVVY